MFLQKGVLKQAGNLAARNNCFSQKCQKWTVPNSLRQVETDVKKINILRTKAHIANL